MFIDIICDTIIFNFIASYFPLYSKILLNGYFIKTELFQ